MNTRIYVMNVNMVEHQRSLMAVMGIDIWMPKTVIDTRVYSNSLYRDQAAPEIYADQIVQKINDTHALQQSQDQASEPIKDIQALKQEKNHQPTAKNIPVDTTHQNAQAHTSAENRLTLKVEAFELQALCLEHCVILVDVTSISAEQNQLWRNIQSAIQGHYFQLKWPFALMNLQDGRGAKSYIQGFLDAICVEKTRISLGQLPHLQEPTIIELPSLYAMLEQPALKAKLWQMMQK